jgi:transposase
MSARPTYSDEFKADAVALVISSGRSPASVAPELGISVTALKRWVRLHNEGQSEGGGKPDDPVDPAKYRALEARLREVERENDFLKKVSAFFAREQR